MPITSRLRLMTLNAFGHAINSGWSFQAAGLKCLPLLFIQANRLHPLTVIRQSGHHISFKIRRRNCRVDSVNMTIDLFDSAFDFGLIVVCWQPRLIAPQEILDCLANGEKSRQDIESVELYRVFPTSDNGKIVASAHDWLGPAEVSW